ncbi:MAG: hypothetical protein ACK4S6_19765 [Roseateles asaccharophilus]|uniref:hypothetical protein n=1 Tax=Roseateles asaccharophilus TaxID=582607 RepID=UPI00391C0B0F
MSNMENSPQQMTLPFDTGNSQPKAEVISFAARKESILASQAAGEKATQTTESEILKRVLERADRLSWYK